MTLLGLTGVAGVGKDLFASLCADYFEQQGKVVRNFALADEVKLQLGDFVQGFYGVSPFTKDRSMKSTIRPLIVAFAEGMKKIHGDSYWTDSLFKKLKEYSFADVLIIKDVRFPIELSKLKEFGGNLIHISRYQEDSGIKSFIQPCNDDEQKNDPIMKDNANLKFSWPNLTHAEASQEVANFLSQSIDIWDKPCLIS